MRLSHLYKRYSTPLNFLNSTLILHGVNLVLTFIVYRYVSPELMGIWATFTTFTTIATILRMGIPNGMNRELPFYLGKGDIDLAKQYASTTLFYTLAISFVLLLIGVVFFSFFDFEKQDFPNQYRIAAICFFFHLIVEPYTTYLSGTFRTNAQFDKLSKIQLYLSGIRLVTIIMVVIWGFNGYIAREFLVTACNLIMLHVWRPLPDIKPHYSMALLKDLFLIGFPIFITSYLSGFIDSIPRLFIIKEGSTMAMGVFSPVVMSLSIVYLIPNTIASYLYPKFSARYGQDPSPLYFWNKMRSLFLLSLGIGIVCFLTFFFFIDYLIQLFPKYQGSAPYIKEASIAIIFIGYKIANVICVVFKQWKWLWISLVSYFIFQTGSILVLKMFIKDILSVASYSLSLTYLLMFIISVYYVYRITHKTNNNE